MNDENQRSTSAVVIGVGSNHGDDQLGRLAVDVLRRRPQFTQHAVEVQETTRRIDQLSGYTCAVIIDAFRSGASSATITRLTWPDPGIELQHGQSTHGVGVADAPRGPSRQL